MRHKGYMVQEEKIYLAEKEQSMEDYQADCNKKIKATMRERNSLNLNTSGKEGVVVRSPTQGNGIKQPIGHIDPGTGKRP